MDEPMPSALGPWTPCENCSWQLLVHQNTTSAGFEPARAMPNRFLVYRLNRSATTCSHRLPLRISRVLSHAGAHARRIIRCKHIYIYIYVYVYLCICVYIYIYIRLDHEAERFPVAGCVCACVCVCARMCVCGTGK
jgi:hypothetical protein